MIFFLNIHFHSRTTLHDKCDTLPCLLAFLKSTTFSVKLGLDEAICCGECYLFDSSLKQSVTVLVETTDAGAFLDTSVMCQTFLCFLWQMTHMKAESYDRYDNCLKLLHKKYISSSLFDHVCGSSKRVRRCPKVYKRWAKMAKFIHLPSYFNCLI